MRSNVAVTELVETSCGSSFIERVVAFGKIKVEEPGTAGPRLDSQHYRELASKLQDIARHCRFPGARQEILALASRYEVRADHLDTRSPPEDFSQDPC